jgi:hypothetical protein
MPTPAATFLAVLATALAGIVSAQTPTDGRPRGIYSMGPAPNLPFVDGGNTALPWNVGEPSPGVYDFSPVTTAIAQHEAIGKRLTLINFVRDVPPDLLANPAVTKWQHPQFGTQPVPWDPTALARWQNYCLALANHLVPSAAQGGTLVPLHKHPALAQVSAPVLGLLGFRIIGGPAETMTGYSRATFTQAFLASIHAMRDRFPSKYAYTGQFPMNDSSTTPTLTDHIRTTLLAEFDGSNYPLLGVFQENWSAHRDTVGGPVVGWPDPTATQGQNNLAAAASTFLMLQAAQGWNCPFTNPANVVNAEAPDGVTWANGVYGCTYFEIYGCDLQDQANWPAFSTLADGLRAAPHQTNQPEATLLVQQRTGFTPLPAASTASLEVLGNPGSLAFVYLGAPREPAGLPSPFGLIDLDLAAGFVNVLAGVLSPQGSLQHSFATPAGPLSGLALQALTWSPAGPLRVSARTTIRIP